MENLSNPILSRTTAIALKMRQEQSSLRQMISSNDDMVNFESDQLDSGMSRLLYNHTFSKTALRKLVGGATATFPDKLQKAISDGVIDAPIRNSGNQRYLLKESEVQLLLDHWGHDRYTINVAGETKKLKKSIVVVANQKGGVGKTTTTVTLGAASAIDLNLRARTLILDLDPQGSLYNYIQASNDNPDEEFYFTMADILLGKSHEENEYTEYLNQYTEEELVPLTAFKTHLSNLDIIPAHPSDARLSDLMAMQNNDEKKVIFERFRDEVIPVLQSIYDVIIIDTPPADSPFSWLALEVADILISPVSPKSMDYASTAAFLSGLENRYLSLPSKGNNLKSRKLVVTNHNPNSQTEIQTKNSIVYTNQEELFSAEIISSEAFSVTSSLKRTVFDIKPGEGLCSARSLSSAVNSAQSVYRQLVNEIIKVSSSEGL